MVWRLRQVGIQAWIYTVVVGQSLAPLTQNSKPMFEHRRSPLILVYPSRFPIREYGMNYESQPLQTHEVASMRADSKIMERILDSYRLMLDFYGMQLVSPDTGLLARVGPPRNFASRYRNLVRKSRRSSPPLI